MTRAALYARFSSDLQNMRSADDQLAMLREEAARRGYTIVSEYKDEAISGASMVLRPGLLQMLRDAQEHRMDIVFAEALDRISRDQADTALINRDLEELDVRIVTLSEGQVEDIHVAFKGLMNSAFRKELSRKTRRGLMAVVNDGRSGGGLTYGYRKADGDKNGLLEINEAEAVIVRRIFADYIAGKSAREIAAALNAEGVTGPRGGDWRASTINGQAHAGNGVLNNELYVGVRIWNRRRKVKSARTGKSRMVANPSEQWKTMPCPDLRIIDAATWKQVKAMQAKRSGKRGGARRPGRLLSGLLQCACCNGPMIVVSTGPRYGCSNWKEKGTCTNTRTIAASELEARVLAGLRAGLLHPEAVRASAEAFHAEMTKLRRETGSRRRDLEKDLGELERRIARTVDAIVETGGSAALRERLKVMEAEKAAKAGELASLTETNVVPLQSRQASKLYADMVAALSEELTAAEADTSEVRTLLRDLISRIVLAPRANEKGYDLIVKGDLAALLSQDGQRIPLRGLVGAGRGFGQDPQLMPFRVPA